MYKDIPGYEGVYQINESGDVISLDRWSICTSRNRFYKGQPMKILKNKSKGGYIRCCFDAMKNGKKTRPSIARLVAQLFVTNDSPATKKEVNHIDGNTMNNHYSNLEWVTHAENMRHASDVLGADFGKSRRGKFGEESNNGKKVKQIDKYTGLEIKTWGSINLAAVTLGISRGTITGVCNGRKHYNTAGGYLWKYVTL